MKFTISKTAKPAGFALALTVAAAAPHGVLAQDGSLLQVPPVLQHAQDPNSGVLTLENSSFMFQKLPPEHEFRELKINDIITVLVDYRTSMLSEGDAEARKTNNLNAFLDNWVKFDGKNLTPDPQPNGPLAVNGNLQSQFRVQSDMELRDQLTFRIAAYIVDIPRSIDVPHRGLHRRHPTERQPGDRSSPPRAE
jgi:flagellar L-ring protein FlgH